MLKKVALRSPFQKKKSEELMNELVTETKANEFLKFIKHSEYNIVK